MKISRLWWSLALLGLLEFAGLSVWWFEDAPGWVLLLLALTQFSVLWFGWKVFERWLINRGSRL